MSTDFPAQTTLPQIAPLILVASLNGRKPRELLVEPDAGQCAAIARYLNLTALRKLRFSGQLTPSGTQDWELSGTLGATIVQPCSVTLAPVTTRIDERVIRRLIADWSEPEGDEVEMTMDPQTDPLGIKIDISAIVIEALSLAIPDFPRAEGVVLDADGVMRAAPEGDVPLDDDAVKPFAGLAALRAKLDRG